VPSTVSLEQVEPLCKKLAHSAMTEVDPNAAPLDQSETAPGEGTGVPVNAEESVTTPQEPETTREDPVVPAEPAAPQQDGDLGTGPGATTPEGDVEPDVPGETPPVYPAA
jgi:hypothetical protein